MALATEIEPKLYGSELAHGLWRLEMEHDNLRAAFAWSRAETDDSEFGLRLAGALFRFWNLQGWFNEGGGWLERTLARAAAPAKALYGAGGLAWAQGDLTPARSRLEESVAIFQEVGDERGAACRRNWPQWPGS